jgi:hypothetical protein
MGGEAYRWPYGKGFGENVKCAPQDAGQYSLEFGPKLFLLTAALFRNPLQRY